MMRVRREEEKQRTAAPSPSSLFGFPLALAPLQQQHPSTNNPPTTANQQSSSIMTELLKALIGCDAATVKQLLDDATAATNVTTLLETPFDASTLDLSHLPRSERQPLLKLSGMKPLELAVSRALTLVASQSAARRARHGAASREDLQAASFECVRALVGVHGSLDRERRTLELGGALLLAAQIENSLPLITLV